MKSLNKFLLLILLCTPAFVSCNNSGEESSNTNQTVASKYLPYEIDKTGTINRFYASDTNSININIPATYSIDEEGKIINGNAYQVKNISDYCFANNNLIQTVNIPDTVTSIGEKAFYNCTNLEKVNVSSYVTYIGDNAFDNCTKLTKITSLDENGLILSENDNLNYFTIPSNITKIGENVLSGWDNLSSLTINDPVKEINNNSITNNSHLKSITINTQLDDIGDNVFSDCPLLTSVNLTESSTGINILNTQNVSKFSIPSSITSIQTGLFNNWKKLKEIYIPDSVKNCSKIFLNNISLRNVTCGSNNFKSLFYSCSSSYGNEEPDEGMYRTLKINSLYYFIPETLKEVHILSGTSLESYCFAGMTSLESVYLPNTMDYFSGEAFYGCTGLKNVYMQTDSDWNYSSDDYYVSDSGIVSKSIVNNSSSFAQALKKSNGYLTWSKAYNS